MAELRWNILALSLLNEEKLRGLGSITSHSACKPVHQCLLHSARSYLGTQSSVTLTPLSRALKRRDRNWSSLVIKRCFLFPGHSSVLDSAAWISKAVTWSAKVQCWQSGSCNTLNAVTPLFSSSIPAGWQGPSQLLLIPFLEAPEQH